MRMTIAEKILAVHSGSAIVRPGTIVQADVDRVMVREALGTAGGVAEQFEKLKVDHVWDAEKIVALLDHWVPPPTVEAAEIHKACRNFVKKYGIKNWYDMTAGICHQVMPEKGHVLPGELIVRADSHTTTYGAFGVLGIGVGATDMAVIFATGKLWFRVPETIRITVQGKLPHRVMSKDAILRVLRDLGPDGANYRSMEFYGDTISEMSMDGRMTLSNMSMEAGAKAAIVPPDTKTIQYVKSRTDRSFHAVEADKDARCSDELRVEASDLDPQVAKPPSPCDAVSVREVEGIQIDEAFIGSCTNGRMEDLRVACEILEGRKVFPAVRLIVIPASYQVYMQALQDGLIESILEAGGIVEAPTCGPCIGGSLGLLASDEVAIATIRRNFVGRMGSRESQAYLASPATVAASAVMGEITDPRTL